MSELFLSMECKDNKTVIADSYFTAPLKIAKPFYQEDHTEIMLMCASPGLLQGDRYDIIFELGTNTKTAISAQSYQKLFRTSEEHSEQNTKITLNDFAELCYLPFPLIPFAGSKFESLTKIYLQKNSKFIYCDILQAGRTGELFAFEKFSARVQVFIEDKLVFLDSARLCPKETDVSGIFFFEGYICQGFMFIYGYEAGEINGSETEGVELSVSKAREGICVRAFANSADKVFGIFNNIALAKTSWRHLCKTM